MPRRKPGQPPKKTGRPAKVTPQHEAEILAILTVGASRQDCADYIGVHYKTLYKYWHAHPDFAVRMAQAEARGKIHHLNKIGKAPQWQASAFMLERKWPLEFGRRDRQDVTLSGKNGGPIQTSHETRHTVDYDAIEAELRAIGGRLAGRASPNGRTEPLHPRDADAPAGGVPRLPHP